MSGKSKGEEMSHFVAPHQVKYFLQLAVEQPQPVIDRPFLPEVEEVISRMPCGDLREELRRLFKQAAEICGLGVSTE